MKYHFFFFLKLYYITCCTLTETNFVSVALKKKNKIKETLKTRRFIILDNTIVCIMNIFFIDPFNSIARATIKRGEVDY